MSRILRWRRIVRPGQAFHASRDRKTRRDSVSLHGHDFAEVFWIDQGAATHFINGVRAPLSVGDVIFIRPSDFHAIDVPSGHVLHLTNIAFPRETYDVLGERYAPRSGASWWQRDKMPFSTRFDPARLASLNRGADRLARSPRERLFAERFLLNLLVDLEPVDSPLLPGNAPEWLVSACREIENPAHFAGGVESFFRLASRSREHVARASRLWLGRSPTEYVNRVRMQYAARQLEMSSQTALEIALDCGISNLGHFYKLFRAEYGTTPRAYRIAHANTL